MQPWMIHLWKTDPLCDLCFPVCEHAKFYVKVPEFSTKSDATLAIEQDFTAWEIRVGGVGEFGGCGRHLQHVSS